MKNYFLSILILTITFTGAFAQRHNNDKSNTESLNGKVYFITLFVDTRDGSWESEEIEHYFEEFERSQSWIADQAEYYDQKITFDNDFFFFDDQETVYISEVTRGNRSKLVQGVVKERGYDDFKHFLKKNRFEASVGRLKIVLFVKSNGRSHAYNSARINNVDIAVVYFQSTYGLMTDEYVISHEILHQFGAWDLYPGESQSLEKAMKAKELYPNSVMINTHSNKESLEVDELTAWRVGWKDIEPEYYQFKPDRNRPKETTTSGKKEGVTLKFKLGKKKKKTDN